MEYRFCFRIAADAKLGKNTQTGQPCPVYAEVKLEIKSPPKDFEDLHKDMGRGFSEAHGLKTEWVIPISTEEYDREVGTDEGEDELSCPCGCGMDPCIESFDD